MLGISCVMRMLYVTYKKPLLFIYFLLGLCITFIFFHLFLLVGS